MRRALVGGGALIMLYAVGGALTDSDVNLVGVPIFLVAVLVLHDGIFLPLVLGAGGLTKRFVPAPWRGTVRAAGVVSLAVSLVAVPLVLGLGRPADNPTILPRAYGPALAGVLALVWLVALAGRWARLRAAGRRARPAPADPE